MAIELFNIVAILFNFVNLPVFNKFKQNKEGSSQVLPRKTQDEADRLSYTMVLQWRAALVQWHHKEGKLDDQPE
jgi:hypothetical protein